MDQQKQSGKARLIKGSLKYLWEEVKTLNPKKLHAIGSMVGGYFSMKFKNKDDLKSSHENERSPQETHTYPKL